MGVRIAIAQPWYEFKLQQSDEGVSADMSAWVPMPCHPESVSSAVWVLGTLATGIAKLLKMGA